jgi:hypothetical protein
MVRSSTAMIGAALACSLSSGSAQITNHGKYPSWKGQWTVILAPGVGGQNVKFDPNKPWGPGQQAPLTPEYQKVLEESMADQVAGGVGNYPSAYCMAGGMPRMMSTGRFEYVITLETTYILVDGDVDLPVESSPTDVLGLPAPSRLMRGTPSASGSMKMATGGMMCSRSRRATSRARAPTTERGCPCISIINRFSRRGSISMQPIRTSFTT